VTAADTRPGPRSAGTALTVGAFHAGLVTGTWPGDDLQQTLTFLDAVARQRGALAVPVAWNCLAFGYDLSRRQYTSDLIDLDALPSIRLDEQAPLLPTGALASLTTASDPVPCEIVYREGDHATLAEDGTVQPWLSGAPAGLEQPPTTAAGHDGDGQFLVDERLVLDAYALGAGKPERLRRLTGRWMDEFRHVRVRTRYLSGEQAELPETRLYAAYLLEHQSDIAIAVLEGAALAADGPEWTTGTLASMLHTSLAAVDDLLTLAGLIRWREQAVHPDTYDLFLDVDDSALSTREIQEFAASLSRRSLPQTARRHSRPATPAYQALGRHLRDAYADTAADALTGPAYAVTIACAQHWLTRHLEDEHDLTLPVRGPDGDTDVHLRLDDAWQGGGIWRAEVVGPDDDLDPVDLPLSLGWLSALDELRAGAAAPDVPAPAPTPDPPPQPTPEPEPQPTPEPESTPEPEPPADTSPPGPEPLPEPPTPPSVQTRSDDTSKVWTFVLTDRVHTGGVVPTTPGVRDTMEDLGLRDAPLQVTLTHPGTDIDLSLRRQPVRLVDTKLHGLSWPEQMFVGLKLTATWAVDGYHIDVRSTALAEPLECNGIPLDYAFDAETVLRSWGSPADVDESNDSPFSPAVLLRVLRRAGRRVPGPAVSLVMGLTEMLPYLDVTGLAEADRTADRLHAQLAAGVDALALRSSMSGSVVVQWARWTWDSTDGERYQRPATIGQPSGIDARELAVVLSLAAKPSGRPSRQPAPASGLEVDVAGAPRREFLRVTHGTPSDSSRARAIEYARRNGIDPSTLHPRVTYVRETSVRRHRRTR
jgi:hypothetical protein